MSDQISSTPVLYTQIDFGTIDGQHHHAENVTYFARSEKLSDDSIKALRCNGIITAVFAALAENKTIRFLAIKKHYNLVEIKHAEGLAGAYDLKAGTHSCYTFKLSEVADFIENVIYTDARLENLAGEVELPL